MAITPDDAVGAEVYFKVVTLTGELPVGETVYGSTALAIVAYSEQTPVITGVVGCRDDGDFTRDCSTKGGTNIQLKGTHLSPILANGTVQVLCTFLPSVTTPREDDPATTSPVGNAACVV